MALVCDYCGDVTQSTERVSVAFGHNQEIALKGATAREWFYYCDDECAEAVEAMLNNLRLFAMHGEGSGLIWALTEQQTAPVAEEVKPAGPPPSEAAAKPEGFDWDAATPYEERQQQKKEGKEAEKSPGQLEREGRLPLTWWLQRTTSIPIAELSARKAAGISVTTAVSHHGSVGNLHNAGIATLEDAAAMTEVEFAGLPGVGVKIVQHMSAALRKNNMAFKPGPELANLGVVLREHREDAGLSVEEVAVIAATSLGAPEKNADGNLGSGAVRGAEQMIRDAERGAKAAAPQILDALGEALDFTRPGVLANGDGGG
jgi:hypothetical protein